MDGWVGMGWVEKWTEDVLYLTTVHLPIVGIHLLARSLAHSTSLLTGNLGWGYQSRFTNITGRLLRTSNGRRWPNFNGGRRWRFNR